jgi:hypothetical protein
MTSSDFPYDPLLVADIEDYFAGLDLRVLTKQVLDNAQAPAFLVNQAMDAMFGEVADPYAAEDGDL